MLAGNLVHPPARLVIRVVLALVTLIATLPGCRRNEPENDQQPTAVKVTVVARADAESGTRYSAQIQPFTRVDLAFRVGGYVERIAKTAGADGRPRLVQEGDRVQSGAELAAVRPTEYAEKLDEARGALGQAKAGLEQTEVDYARNEKLVSQGSLATAELDVMRIKRDSARSALQTAEARLEQAQTALNDTRLRSPIDGVLLSRSVESGTLAAPGAVAFAVADLSRVKVVFGVPDTMLARVRLGAPQQVTSAAFQGVTFQGTITRIAPSADAKSRVFEIEVTIANQDERLKAGMVAALSLADGEAASKKPEPLVPLAAIVRSPRSARGFAVFVVSEDRGHSVAHLRDIELGEYLGRVIPALTGLDGGERVVVQGAGLLSDGETVQVIP
jgi:RND family efflux transporter MFP subunit